ncbi:MAG: glycosyltransferase family 4 protein [Cyclobacteriaceae bacterium]
MSKRILLLCPHPEGVAPGQRLKYEQYFEYLKSNGYDIQISPFMSKRFWGIVYRNGRYPEKIFWTIVGYLVRLGDLFRVPFYDGVFVFLWVTPFGTTFFEKIVSAFSKNLLYDIDDLVFMKPKSTVNPIAGLFKSSQKPIVLMKNADHVITCTPYLDQLVRKHNQNTTDISSTINTETYLPVNRYSNCETLVLGWSGSFSTSLYLRTIVPILRKIQMKYRVKILIIGDPNFSVDGLRVESVAWSQEKEVETLQKIDIGLYPLPDEEWVQGKSGLKALQYMALGIPTVATAIGANFRIIENGVSGYLVNTSDEWENRLIDLIENEGLRKSMGVEARKSVVENYSIEANKDIYLKIFNEVYSKS